MGKIGSSSEHFTEFAAAVRAEGATPGCIRVFMQPGESATGGNWLQEIQAAGAGVDPLLSAKLPSGITMAQLATNGSLVYYEQIADRLIAADIRNGELYFFHEPEDDVEGGSFTAAQFKAAATRVIDVLRAKLNSRGWLIGICLMKYTITNRNPNDYLPANAQVIAWDTYNKGSAGDPPKPAFHNKDPRTVDPVALYKPCSDYSASKGMACSIGETACARREADSAGVERSEWWEKVDTLNLLDAFRHVCHYEVGVVDNRAEYAIRNEKRSLRAFISACTPVAPPPPPPPPGETDAQKIARLTAELATAIQQRDAAAAALATRTSERDAALAERDVARTERDTARDQATAYAEVIDSVHAATART